MQRKEGWFSTFDLDNTDIVSSVQYCSTNIFKEISDMNETNFVDWGTLEVDKNLVKNKWRCD